MNLHNVKYKCIIFFITAASKHNIKVRLMLSERAYTYKHRKEHLTSLLDFNKEIGKALIEIKVFHVSCILRGVFK